MSMTSGQATGAPAAPAGQGGRSHLAPGAHVAGDLTVPGLIELVGRVEGRLNADSVVIEDRGSVEGEVHAATVVVRGEFNGTLTAGAVRLHSTARVTGRILYDTLSIESGAEVTATCSRTVPA